MKLRYDLGSMTPGVLVSPRVDEVDLTLTGGLNSFTLRGSIVAIRALLTDATAVLDQVRADGNTHYKIKENNMSNPANHHRSSDPVDEPSSLNLSLDSLPNVSLEHDFTTDEVHIKFFNVDNEIVLDLGGQLNDVGPLLSGLSIIAKYHALRTGLYKAVAKEDSAGAVEYLNALKSLQRTPEFGRVFENVDVTMSDSPKKEPPCQAEVNTAHLPMKPPVREMPLLPESGIAVLTGEEAEALLAMLDKKFNGQ